MNSLRPSPSALKLLLLVCCAVALGACNSPTEPTSNAPFSQEDLRVGIGANAVAGSVLTVHYTGWLYNAAEPDNKGAQFDSSAGFDPLVFTLGNGGVIAGWDQGLVGMKVGGLRRLIIPPSLGYGGVRRGPIPPNATMLFEVELLDVQ